MSTENNVTNFVAFLLAKRFFDENGDLHCIDGPACIYIDGRFRWFLHGKEYTKEEYEQHPDVIAYQRLFFLD